MLKSREVTMLDQYLKRTVQRLMKLAEKTPACVVAFLAGQLPARALLHQHQLVLFGMVSRMPGSVLHRYATHILTSARPGAASWFQLIRDLCVMYNLPHPLSILAQPTSKAVYNRKVQSKITDYWESELRANVLNLTSTPFFNPKYMSLRSPHPLWLSAGSNPFECRKAVIAARMLSGRYPTDRLCRHWSQNKDGYCQLPACAPTKSPGSLEHLLLNCSALDQKREKLVQLCLRLSSDNDTLSSILVPKLYSDKKDILMQLILDCTVLPDVIKARQDLGPDVQDKLLYIGRTWCYTMHRERLNQRGLYSYR